MCICENKCICNGLNADTITPIVGQAVNWILMQGQGLGQGRQKPCRTKEKLKKKNRKCCGCRTYAVFRLVTWD